MLHSANKTLILLQLLLFLVRKQNIEKRITDPIQYLQLRNDCLDLPHVVSMLRPWGTERVLIQEQLSNVFTFLQNTLQL